MSALLTMQTSEFTTFALDCGLMTDDFGTACINNMVVRGLAKHSSCSRNRGGGGSPAAQVAERDRSGWVARGQQNVHWYHSTQAAWLHCRSNDIEWTGWSAESASPVAMPLSDWQPWTAVSDETS